MKPSGVNNQGGCPFGCSAGSPVCAQGKSLYSHARKLFCQLPQRYPDRPTRQQQQLFDEWQRWADAYVHHIGS